MASNSKLTDVQKQIRRELMTAYAAEGVKLFSFPDLRVTVAVQRKGTDNFRAAWAISSPQEKKFRRKVGEMVALTRFDEGIFLPFEGHGWGDDPESSESFATRVAHFVTVE